MRLSYYRPMQISNLRYLVALDRERHFARAAELCNVSQPTLSTGLVALENQLGRRLVERDRRFVGFTPAGEAVLPWARQVIAGMTNLARAADEVAGPLEGQAKLGAIPASMPITGTIAATLHQRHPGLRLAIHSLTSREIERGLAEYDLDAGLTYIEHEPPAHVVSVPLYAERMVFVERGAGPGPTSIGLADALSRPLCLLHQGMQNRRILDANLARSGHAVAAAATADSYVALLALVQSGAFATIMPDSYATLIPAWARIIPFDPPMPASRIGLAVSDRSPISQLAQALLAIVSAPS